ncbi:hypothetical protein EJ03DRAFT_349676 [Teratosphaeria nubilosa]|uniref:Uncharacterized protein n=1 Tax=Teratosphaeria nubilosa TaxID=161662 RepID=A0A6G1LEF3_9PEZI|nr:hypothetical protein EJ03DRAFT_349676 [Teratosphaeria nubilosa]
MTGQRNIQRQVSTFQTISGLERTDELITHVRRGEPVDSNWQVLAVETVTTFYVVPDAAAGGRAGLVDDVPTSRNVVILDDAAVNQDATTPEDVVMIDDAVVPEDIVMADSVNAPGNVKMSDC